MRRRTLSNHLPGWLEVDGGALGGHPAGILSRTDGGRGGGRGGPSGLGLGGEAAGLARGVEVGVKEREAPRLPRSWAQRGDKGRSRPPSPSPPPRLLPLPGLGHRTGAFLHEAFLSPLRDLRASARTRRRESGENHCEQTPWGLWRRRWKRPCVLLRKLHIRLGGETGTRRHPSWYISLAPLAELFQGVGETGSGWWAR